MKALLIAVVVGLGSVAWANPFTITAAPTCYCKAGECHCCKGCACGGAKKHNKKAKKKAKVNDRQPVRYYQRTSMPFRSSNC